MSLLLMLAASLIVLEVEIEGVMKPSEEEAVLGERGMVMLIERADLGF